MIGEVQPLDISARARGYQGMWKRVPIGPCSLHLAVQFPAQPGRAQDRPRDRRRLPVRDEARQPHAAGRADHRRGAGRDRPAEGRLLHPARPPRGRRPVHHRRAAEAALLHRLARGRLGPEGAAPARRRWCSSSAATRRSSSTDIDGATSTTRSSGSSSAPSTSRARAASACSGSSSTPTSTTSCATGWSARTKTLVAGDPQGRGHLHRPDDRREGEARAPRRLDPGSGAGGATLLCGGRREGAMLEATLLEGVDRDGQALSPRRRSGRWRSCRASTTSTPRSTRSTTSKFGLQAGVFTRDLFKMLDGVGPARRRRRRDQRCPKLPRRQHALWRREGLGPRPRRREVRDGRHDGDPEPRDPRACGEREQDAASALSADPATVVRRPNLLNGPLETRPPRR